MVNFLISFLSQFKDDPNQGEYTFLSFFVERKDKNLAWSVSSIRITQCPDPNKDLVNGVPNRVSL